MCGIAGFIGTTTTDSLLILKNMTDVIAHRGPDDEGFYIDTKAALGFRRLAIIDLNTGHQPMKDENGRYVIVFNGEIYNYREIRRTLEAKGYQFRTSSDTEVLLYAYAEWNVHCLQQLNGMFAFAIWDSREYRLFAARDRLGVKPFYYTVWNGYFIFASEIKSILEFPGYPTEPDYTAFDDYMSFLWTPEPATAFRHIQKIPSGHYLLYENGAVQLQEYWDAPLTWRNARTENELIDELITILEDSVRLRMISDVPLGAFLSGGIDSTAIVAMMNRLSHEPINTYTIGFAEKDLRHDIVQSDVEYARYAKNHLNIHYKEIFLEPRVMDLFPKLVWHMDEPVADPAAISTYLICKASRETLTVMLSGVGGDEIFGGYPRYVAMKLARQYQRVPRRLRRIVEKTIIQPLPASRSSHFRNLKKFVKSANLPFHDCYLGYRTYFTEIEKEKLYTPDFRSLVKTSLHDPFFSHRQYFEKAKFLEPLNQMMYVDLKTFLPCLNLQYTDKMSMAASIEVREPLLDYRLVEWMTALSPSWKVKGLRRKYLFKRAMKGLVPDKIIGRKKAGFGAPIRSWIVHDLRPMVEDLLSEDSIRKRGLFNPGYVRFILDQEYQGIEYYSNHIWQLLTLEMWFRTFIDKK